MNIAMIIKNSTYCSFPVNQLKNQIKQYQIIMKSKIFRLSWFNERNQTKVPVKRCWR